MTSKSALLSQLIRNAESISPADRYDKIEFWGRELRRTWSFLMDHEEYYVSYLQKRVQAEDMEGCASNKRLPQESEMQELISVGMEYFEYAQGKLDQLRGRWQNSYFLRA